MRDETVIDEREAEEMNEAMDYAQHEKTWEMFIALVKSAIVQLAFIVVGLFCIIEGGIPLLGGLLILIGLVYPLGAAFFKTAR